MDSQFEEPILPGGHKECNELMTPKPYSIESVSTRESIPKGAEMCLYLPTVFCCLPWRAESHKRWVEASCFNTLGQGILRDAKEQGMDGDSTLQYSKPRDQGRLCLLKY